eukprot:448684-Rhodomonas_salina.1
MPWTVPGDSCPPQRVTGWRPPNPAVKPSPWLAQPECTALEPPGAAAAAGYPGYPGTLESRTLLLKSHTAGTD